MEALAVLALLLLAVLAVGSVSYVTTYQFTPDGGTQRSKTLTITGGAAVVVSETIPASSTDLQIVGFSLDISQLKSLYICASAAMTLETNSSSAPQDTITLAADQPLVWTNVMPQVAIGDIFGGDVTALYVTSSAGGLLEIFAAYDPTP